MLCYKFLWMTGDYDRPGKVPSLVVFLQNYFWRRFGSDPLTGKSSNLQRWKKNHIGWLRPGWLPFLLVVRVPHHAHFAEVDRDRLMGRRFKFQGLPAQQMMWIKGGRLARWAMLFSKSDRPPGHIINVVSSGEMFPRMPAAIAASHPPHRHNSRNPPGRPPTSYRK